MKDLYSYKRVPYCKTCMTVGCKKFTKCNYHTNICCMCNNKEICKVCKKEKPDNPILLKREFIHECGFGSVEDVTKILEKIKSWKSTLKIETCLLEGYKNSCVYDNTDIVKLLLNEIDDSKLYEIGIIDAFKNASLSVIKFLLDCILDDCILNCILDSNDNKANDYIGYIFRKLDGPAIVLIKNLKSQKDIEKYENKYKEYRINLFNLLVSKGANDFNFCLLNSCIYQNVELAKLSIENGANNISESLIIACNGGTSINTDLINYLLSEKYLTCMDINTYNQCLYNLCSINISNDYNKKNKSNIPLYIVKFIELGANNYNQCLIKACENDNIFAIDLLINKGANNFNTAMYYVSKSYSNVNEIKKILIKHGANKYTDYH